MSAPAATTAAVDSSVKDKEIGGARKSYINNFKMSYRSEIVDIHKLDMVQSVANGKTESKEDDGLMKSIGLSLYSKIELGEPDWSLEDVDCVLHWIAGGTISERKGTELLNVIFGKSLSRYTVRSKVKALKEKVVELEKRKASK
ncbi:unnamed protein product [Wuchereria bancrofti]|uniref:Uncharacterized protein n=1 Tax=Wuchereria bancrofti TaxID=6293 RepID=A0A3P7FX14_WUCBA|nr:unnamed protein product [Wuchereria bancrofti]